MATTLKLQKPLEATAVRLYTEDASAARNVLANFSRGIYLSVIEAMDGIAAEVK